jgi:DNA-binding response OmpR family regulator
VVDDEKPLAAVVARYFEREGYAVTQAHDGPTALDLAREVDPHVVVLDLGLPRLDGVEVCRGLRTFSDCYVVMLTARAEEADTLTGLAVGADDYVTKPFSPRELLARVQAMLRRPRQAPAALPPEERRRTLGPLTVDPTSREAWLGSDPVTLTRTEFDLLDTLSSRPQQAFSRRQLIHAIWGKSWVGNEHLVDVHIGNLRRKLGDDAASPRFIRTVRGFGYRMGGAVVEEDGEQP